MSSLWVDALWVIGLAGIVATLSHEGWQRSYARNQGGVYSSTLQLWYSLGALLVSLGLFLRSLGAEPRTPAWMLAVWGAMVLLSCSTLIASARSARRSA